MKGATQRIVDPFAFQPDTNGYFSLLIIAGCFSVANAAYLFRVTVAQNVDLFALVVFGTSASLIALTCAYGAYLLHPKLILARDGARILNRTEDPLFFESLEFCMVRTSLTDLNVCVVRARVKVAQVVGLGRRYHIMINDALPLLNESRPDLVKSILFHELGHIANGDVRRYYLAQSLWRTIALANIVLFYFLALRSQLSIFEDFAAFTRAQSWLNLVSMYSQHLAPYLWPLGITTLVFFLTLSTLVTSREYFADARVCQWGETRTLASMLENMADQKDRNVSLLRTRLHPRWDQRSKAVRDPNVLSRIPLLSTLLAGFWMGILWAGFGPLVLLVGNLIASTRSERADSNLDAVKRLLGDEFVALMHSDEDTAKKLLEGFIPTAVADAVLLFSLSVLLVLAVLVASSLITVTIGHQIQRAALTEFAAPAVKVSHMRMGLLSLVFALGLGGGQVCTPIRMIGMTRPEALLSFVLWLCAAALCLWICLLEYKFLSVSFLRFSLGRHRPAKLQARLCWIFCALLFFLSGPLFFWSLDLIGGGSRFIRVCTIIAFVVGLCANALLVEVLRSIARLRRKRTLRSVELADDGVPSWLCLDKRDDHPTH